MKIYVASSWRNDYQPEIVRALRELGHDVYDFKNPAPGDNGFHWSEIDPAWQKWTVEQYITSLYHPVAVAGFDSDFSAMQWADACVLVMPCGRSAHIEAGYFVGAGKPLLILASDAEPELMYKMADSIHAGMGSLLVRIQEIDDERQSLEPLEFVLSQPAPSQLKLSVRCMAFDIKNDDGEDFTQDQIGIWQQFVALLNCHCRGLLRDPEEDAIGLIEAERLRQIDKGYDEDHDDLRSDGSILHAAVRIAGDVAASGPHVDKVSWFGILARHVTEKYRGDPTRRLTIAGALIAAEIDRLRRLPASC